MEVQYVLNQSSQRALLSRLVGVENAKILHALCYCITVELNSICVKRQHGLQSCSVSSSKRPQCRIL